MKTTSDYISEFLKFIDAIKNNYQLNYALVNEKDRENQDHLHMLELGGLRYKSRARLATQMQRSRKERRQAKDIVSVLEPLVILLDDAQTQKTINRLRQALGEVRRREEKLEIRTYRKRLK